MLRQEAADQYLRALKRGQKCYRNAILHGKYPYPQVLDEILDESMNAAQIEMGLVEIPTDQIVGTKTAGRKSSFASNFMPLMGLETEFGAKWVQLCVAHLSDEGIREPVRCFEYLGRFYVQEGNKRVSVLKSYEASTIPGYVIRVVPAYSDDLKVQVYYEFMKYYQQTGLYQISFSQLGSTAKFQAALGFDPDHVWTEDERKAFLSRYTRFRDFFRKQGGEDLDVTVCDAMLVWLRIHSFRELKEMTASELSKSVSRIWPDVKLISSGEQVTINTEPQLGDKGLMSYFSVGKPNHIKVAFFFHADPKLSAFTRSHELGAQHVVDMMGEHVTVACYYNVKAEEAGEWLMERAVAEGADVLVATAPPLIANCRKVAARHPNLKILTCALSMPYTGVRTYYSRIYEAKFIAGAIAAAVSRDDVLGYVADYPIYGVPASINAYALGARMVNPNARVRVAWSCVDDDPYAIFKAEGVRTITNRELPSPEDDNWSRNQGTYRVMEDGHIMGIGSPAWIWGAFYEKVLTTILTGAWDTLGSKGAHAVGYWWGMNSGVIDVQLSPDLPAGVRCLAECLRRDIIDHSIDPFRFPLRDQNGVVHSDGNRWLIPDEIMRMDWLLDCVDGEIPSFDKLKPISQKLVRVLGVYRDQIPPEKEGVLL